MDSDEQREQVAFFGDHLRRSMMESFEQVVKARLGKIKDACDTSNKLVDALRQGIGAAEQYKRERKNSLLGWAGVVVGLWA